MTELILIRHGETAWNAESRLQGHIDIELNPQGGLQAVATGRFFATEKADCVISSDLVRAVDTARPIALALGLEIVLEPELRERCFGGFEGLQSEEIRERHPAAWQQWQVRDCDARFPGGSLPAETLNEFFARVERVLRRIATRRANQKIILVTHGGVLDCAYRLAAGIPLGIERDFEIRNASINRLRWNNGLKITAWGQVDHLKTTLDEIGG